MNLHNVKSNPGCSLASNNNLTRQQSPLICPEPLMLVPHPYHQPLPSHYFQSCLGESILKELSAVSKPSKQSCSNVSTDEKPLSTAAKRRHRRKRNQLRRYAFLNATIHGIVNTAAASILGSQKDSLYRSSDRKPISPLFVDPNSLNCNHSNEHFYNCYNASSYKIKSRLSVKESHQLAEISKDRNDKLKSALKISEDFVPGSSMDIIRQAKEQQAAREEKLRANKDLISATIKSEQNESIRDIPLKDNSSKHSRKRAASDTSSDSSSSDSSESSDSSDDSDSSSSSDSSSDSSDSEIDTKKGRYSKEKSRRNYSKNSSTNEKHTSKSKNSFTNEKHSSKSKNSSKNDYKRSPSSGKKTTRNDSLPRKYSRYSTSIERTQKSNSPPRRQLQSFVSSKHRQSYRSKSKSYENERSPKVSSNSARRRSSSRHGDSRSRSRSNSYVASRRRERSYSRSISPRDEPRSYSRRNGVSTQRRDSSRSRSRSPSPRYRKDSPRRGSYYRSKDNRRRSPSSSRSRSRSRSFSPNSDRSSRSRSRSIPKRRGSPSFLDKRRITRY